MEKMKMDNIELFTGQSRSGEVSQPETIARNKEIQRLWSIGKHSQIEIAKLFAVKVHTICNIVNKAPRTLRTQIIRAAAKKEQANLLGFEGKTELYVNIAVKTGYPLSVVKHTLGGGIKPEKKRTILVKCETCGEKFTTRVASTNYVKRFCSQLCRPQPHLKRVNQALDNYLQENVQDASNELTTFDWI
jgi:DNA-binding CsgD family transcriptional regulator